MNYISTGALPRWEEEKQKRRENISAGALPRKEAKQKERKEKNISSGALPQTEEKKSEMHFDRGSAPGGRKSGEEK